MDCNKNETTFPYYRVRWTAENQDDLYEIYFTPLLYCLDHFQSIEWERNMEARRCVSSCLPDL